MSFGTKAQKKPLDLLCALIAFGGRDVPLEKLAQALWPDTEGDMAASSLEITLHRLRRLLGEDSIKTNNSRLSFDPEYCWIDMWAFEQLADTAEDEPLSLSQARHLFDLYRGSFFSDVEITPVLLQRQRLRSKFLRAVTSLGHAMEGNADYAGAVECFQKGIEVDPLAENLYRHLMKCYLRLNLPAEAMSVYRSCQTMLSSILDIEPSSEMKELYTEIKNSSLSR